MQSVDKMLNGRWVLPIAPQNIVLEYHSIIIDQKKIIDLLPTSEAKKRYQAKSDLSLNEHVLMPGLVNAHAHSPMNLFRGLADDLSLMDWLQNHIWPAEQAIINEQSVADGCRLACLEMIRGGVTCFNDHYFFHDTIAKTVAEMKMRACVGLLIINVPTAWAENEHEYLQKALKTLEHSSQHSLIHWAMAPHAPYTVTDSALKQIKEIAQHFKLPIHMHVHETRNEIETSLKDFGKRPLTRLHELGLLAPNFINVHMTQLIAEEIEILKNSGAHVVHCPESNLKLASGFAPIADLLAAGINIALGTDSAASNNDLDLLAEMQTAALLAKGVSGDPTALPASTALAMATIQGAKALGLEKQIGSIEKNKSADIIAIDLSSYITQPIYDPISHLVYAANRLQVSDVWIDAEHILHNNHFILYDTQEIIARAKYWQKNIMEL